MKVPVLASVDLGSSAVKATLIDAGGHILAATASGVMMGAPVGVLLSLAHCDQSHSTYLRSRCTIGVSASKASTADAHAR